MSFDHRFGVGNGGSYEDPYQPQCCDECQLETCPFDDIEKCGIYQNDKTKR